MNRIGQIIFLITIPTFLIISCDNRPFKVSELVGINDTAFYTFDPSTDEVCFVDKKRYMYSPYYSVQINRDTISLGQDFEGYLGAYRGNYKIIIDEPRKEIIEGIYKEPKEGEPHEAITYKFETIQTGNFNFKGRIEIDTLIIPFEYKFIVIED